MDKDELFKQLEQLNSVAFEEYFSNQKWQEESALVCQPKIQREKEYKILSYDPKDKTEKAESNIMKSYSQLIEDSYYTEKINKEFDEMITEKASMFATSIHDKNDEFFERKVNLYDNFILGYSGSKSTVNQLIYNRNPKLEKQLMNVKMISDSHPGLDPSNWFSSLESLDDLLNKLSIAKFEEFFYQPFDMEKESMHFTQKALEVIRDYDSRINSNNGKNTKNEEIALIKSVSTLLTIEIFKGNFCEVYNTLFQLSQLKNKHLLNAIFTDTSEINAETSALNPSETGPLIRKVNPLFNAIKSLFILASENNYLPYPIMRNYSIIDYFNLSQVILYAKGKQPFSDCSICSDGTFIYAIITGINGCKMKIGTGFNGSVRGKVYKHIIMPDEASYQWVYCKGKIYLKSYSSIFPLKEFGYLRVISPETLQEEGKIKLNMPKNITHSLVLLKNENFVLLSDGNCLGILVLKPSSTNDLKRNQSEDNDDNSNKDFLLNNVLSNDDLIKQIDLYSENKDNFKFINLELITYNPQPIVYNEDLDSLEKMMTKEIYDSFNMYYTMDECYKALVKNKWKIKETAEYLSTNPAEIKQAYLEGNDPVVLFQSRFEVVEKSGKTEKVMMANPFFCVIQFNYLKWSLTDRHVIAHQIKEGACAIFSRVHSDSKLFNYSSPSVNDHSAENSILKDIKDLKDIKKGDFDQVSSKIQKLKELFEKKVIEMKQGKETVNYSIKGTLIKLVPTIQLLKYDYLSTYDNVQKCYFLLTTASLSCQSILIVDTFINTAVKYNELLFDNNEDSNNSLNKLHLFFSSFIAKERQLIDFKALLSNLFNLMLIMTSSKKYDSYWRYSNISFSYNHIIDKAMNVPDNVSTTSATSTSANTSSTSFSLGNSNSNSNEYSQPFIPFIHHNSFTKKTLSIRLEKIAQVNKSKLFNQIPKELKEKCNVIEVKWNSFSESNYKKKHNKQYPSPYLKNSGNWLSDILLMFKSKGDNNNQLTIDDAEKVKNKVMLIDNNRQFYMSIDGNLDSIDFLLNMYYQSNFNFNTFNTSVSYLNKETLMRLIYIWISNYNDSIAITNPIRNKEIFELINSIIDQYINKSPSSTSNEKSICVKMLIEGWEYLAPDYDSQIKWFKTLYKYQSSTFGFNVLLSNNIEQNIIEYGDKYPFSILLQKMDMCNTSNALLNNFNKINIIKCYSFYPFNYSGELRLIAKPSYFSVSPRHMQLPFYWGLLDFNLNKITLASEQLTVIDYVTSSNQDDIKEKIIPSYSTTFFSNSKDGHIHSLALKIPNKTSIELFRSNTSDFKEESIWSLMNSIITSDNSSCLLNFLNKIFSLVLVDLNRIYNEFLNLNDSNTNSNAKSNLIEKNDFFEMYTTFLFNAYNHITKLSPSKSPHKSIAYLNLFTNYIYNIFSKINTSTLKTISVLREILTKAQNDNSAILSQVTLLNEQGTQIENSKVSEYILSNDEITTISKKVAFDSNIIVVTIDFRISKSDGKNYRDLVCMSEYHASNNCLTNNLNKYGTCYQTQLNNNFEKVFYIKGKEIKIVSPSAILYNKSTVAKFNSKAFLKIKAFPYNNQLALIATIDKEKDHIPELITSAALLQDIEYFSSLIDTNLLKSFEIEKEELLKKDSITKLGFKSYQNAVNAFDYYYHHIPYNMTNYKVYNCLLSNLNMSIEQKDTLDLFEMEQFVQLTRQKIREKTPEPNDFIFLRKLPSFTPEYKAKWNKVELALLNTLLYHLGLYDDFKKAFEKNNLIVIEPFFDAIGKKLNIILSQMSSKAKEFKHSYDTIKSNIDDFVKAYNEKYDEIKKKLCEEIQKSLIKNKQHKKSCNVYNGKSNILLSSVSTKEDISKQTEKHKGHSITPIKKKKRKIKEEDQMSFEQDINKELEKLKQKLKSNFKDESIGDIVKSYKHYLLQDSIKALSQLKTLHKTHKTIIEEDMHNNLYGNIDKIKAICEGHGIAYNESNPSDSIKTYAKYIYDQFTSMLPIKEINSHSPIDKMVLENCLIDKSPFNTVAQMVSDKALFLLSLNQYDEKTKEDFPFLERLTSITRENSRTNSTRRTKSKNSEDNSSYLFNAQQLIILKAVMNFFSAQNESIPFLRFVLNKQFIRAKIRSISLKGLSKSLVLNNVSKQSVTNYILGIISASIKGDIKNGIESVQLDNSPQCISRIVNYCINSFISTINELKSLFEIAQANANANSSSAIIDHNRSIIIQVSNYQPSSEKIDYRTQLNILFKKGFLALSDINILIKEIKRNIHNYNENGLFDIKQYSNFIATSLSILFTQSQSTNGNLTKMNSIKKHCDDLIRIILTKMLSMSSLSSLSSLSDSIFNELSNELTKALETKDNDNIAKVLEVILQMIQNGKDTNCMIKLSSILIDLIEQSDKYEIIVLSSRLFLQMFKVTNQNINVTKLFTKIGKLFMFKSIDNIDKLPITLLDGPYHIIVQINSTEVDYQFLVNALFYWEEKYPTMLSTNDQTNPANYPLLTVNDETGYKVEKYSYFNVLKAKTNKMHLLDTVVNEKMAVVTKGLAEANTAKNENQNDKQIDERIEKLKREEKYLERIRTHIKLAQEIGENASIRGFALLDPPLPSHQAKEFAELIHKANNRMLPHFKSNLNDNVNLFNDDILYPKMPKREVMAPGCVNTLKETIKSYVNVTLVYHEEVGRLKDNWKTFVELAKKNHIPEDKKVKVLSALKHFIPEFSQNTLKSVNYNEPSIPKIIHQNSISGASITISIDTLIHLIYSAYQKDLNSLIKQIRIRLQRLKDEWPKDSELKFNTLGMLIVAADYYKILHKNSRIQMDNNICHIISGGNKSGQLTSDIIYPITTSTSSVLKIERIQTDLLDKYEHNNKLLKNIPFSEIVDALLFSCDLQSTKDSICNKNLLHMLLKILQMKKIEAEDLVNYIKKKKDSFDKLFTFLNKNSNNTIWLEQEDKALENEFIESFERIYNKLDSSNQRIYSPTFILDLNSENKYHPIEKVKHTTDIISNNNLPLTNYVKQVPRLSDFSKSNDVLKNIQVFDRYLVMEIFNYCKTHYRDSEYENSLTQVRNHIANGDLKNAIIDLNTIFDDRQSAPHITFLKDCYDSREITKEEIYPGNYYLAKLTKKFIRQSKIQSLIKLDRVGIYDVTVLVLIQDNALNQALVLFNDDDCGKITTFWVNSDQLMFNAKPIKMPSSSFPLQVLVREYKYLHKRLTILYSKNALNDIMNCLTKKQSIYSGNDLMNCLILNNWKKFKLNPVSGVYHIFNNYIAVKKNESLDNVDSLSSSMISIKEYSEKEIDDNFISDLIKGIGQKDAKDSDEYNNEILLDKIISSFSIDNKTALDIILKWCMTKWSSINQEFHSILLDLFIEYNTSSKEKMRSKDMFHIGILNNKLLALHELFSLDKMQHCGIILTFDKKAYLSPHARLTFYSDPYGENMIHEIASIKTVTSNLPICVFNYPKVWVNYMPGTSSFEGRNWDANTCNSCLTCTISLIPYYWSPLIQLTDYCTSAIFNDIKKESMNYYQKIIRELIIHCLEMSLPAEIQRRIFNITNRAILKCFKFISLLESHISYNQKSISEKLMFIGIDEQSIIKLITKINEFATQNEDKSLSSAYLVEGVEILLSILSFIQVPYTQLDTCLRTTYKFELPIWIEAIMKLGQFLTYMQGNNMLEQNVACEITEQLKINSKFDHLIMIQLKDQIQNNDNQAIMMNSLRGVLEANDVLIVDYDKDVLFINHQTILILLDGFVISSLNKEEEKKEEKEEEEPLWMCADCQNENDKDNSRCVFCDGPKRVKPKEKKPKKIEKKSHFAKENQLQSSLATKMDTLKANLGFLFKEGVITQCEEHIITQSPFKELLNAFLFKRLQLYTKDKDYFNEKMRIIKLSGIHSSEIVENLESPQEIQMIALFTKMMQERIDFWLEDTSLPNDDNIPIDISLMERIREIIDKNVCKDSKYSLILSPTNLRVLPLNSNSINHSALYSLNDIPLSLLRYYWAVMQYFNKCLEAALPYIKPPDYYSSSNISTSEEGYVTIPFPRTISAFLSSARGIMYSFIKNELIKEVLLSSEYSENDIQTPIFKFERLLIANSIERKEKNQKNNRIEIENNDDNDEDDNEQKLIEYQEEDSMFLQAYEQYKNLDPAFFRIQKVKGDPHIAFKVEFKGELVQGLGGPYRQFFSDISSELNSKLSLLQPSCNNVAKKGDYQDKYTIASCENSRTALNHFEFLGFLMGICIRTGVRLTIDLSSIVWKKIIDEVITLNDIYQYDEGLYSMIKLLADPNLIQDKFKSLFNLKFEIELTNGTIRELIPNGSNISVNFNDRIKFVQLAVKHRINECDTEIDAIRKGISKIIPISLLKLLTHTEIEKLVCGNKTVDIALLKRNTKLSFDLQPESNKVKWLWEILNEISDEDKVRFIKFCWAQERLPSSDEEFTKLQVTFTIKSYTDKNKIDVFPKADTCFFNLELPEYSSKEVMKRKLLQAISLDNIGMNADKVIAEPQGRYESNARQNYEDENYNYDYDYQYEYD